MNLDNLKIGSVVQFGTYPQGANGEVKPIEWEVLSVENGEALLISKYALDCKQFNTRFKWVKWGKCSLRKWLNDDFYNKAFSESDKSKIVLSTVTADKNPLLGGSQGKNTQDKVFLLSVVEANKYFSSDEDRKCIPTEYAKNQVILTSDECAKNGIPTCMWWLRSPGESGFSASIVVPEGCANPVGFKVSERCIVVRPALKINL